MGLISWLKNKLFHKKKEEIREDVKPVEKKEEVKVETKKELDDSLKNIDHESAESKPENLSSNQDLSHQESIKETSKDSTPIVFSKTTNIFGGETEVKETPKEEIKESQVSKEEVSPKEPVSTPKDNLNEIKSDLKEEEASPKEVTVNPQKENVVLEASEAIKENPATESEPLKNKIEEAKNETNVFEQTKISDLLEESKKEIDSVSNPAKENKQDLTNSLDEIKENERKEANISFEASQSKEPVSEEKLVQEEKAEQTPVEKKENEGKVQESSADSSVDKETKIYNLGLAKSRESFGVRLNNIANKYKEANSDYFDELERCLIEADVGVKLTMNVLDETEKMAAVQHIQDPKQINDLLVDNLFMNYAKAGSSFQTEIQFDPVNPTILLVVGVNGTGKTTTIAKLAKHYKAEGKKVMVIAADTFRAGAVEQLSLWAKKVGVDCFEHGQGADPASVCYDGVKKAISEKYDLVLVDTAGRLHTKDYLMAELGKIVRVIKKILPVAPQETWLVLDANTGQNGVMQAKVFKEVTSLTGVVISKMDGTSKGGIILAIRDQLGVPVRFIGLGEHEDDLREFDLDRYLYALLVGEDIQDN